MQEQREAHISILQVQVFRGVLQVRNQGPRAEPCGVTEIASFANVINAGKSPLILKSLNTQCSMRDDNHYHVKWL